MKRQFVLIISLAFLSFFAKAQQVHYGLEADMNLTGGATGKGLSSKLQPGFDAGGFAEIHLNKKFSLQPELLFSLRNLKKGSDFLEYYVNQGKPFSNDKIQLGYITVPVLLKYNLFNYLSLNLGPQVSYRVYNNEDLLLDGKPAFKKVDAGLAAGAQLNLSQNFNIYARYYYGITNINNIDDRYTWHSQSLQFGLALRVF